MGVNSPEVVAKVNHVMWMREVLRVINARNRFFQLRAVARQDAAKANAALVALWVSVDTQDPLIKAHCEGRARHFRALLRTMPD